MSYEEIKEIFLEELRSCCCKKKYTGQFDEEDEERAVRAIELVLENPSLSDNLIFEILTGVTE